MLYQLSKLPTLSLFLTTKLVYRPANIAAKPIAKHLFYNDYMNHLGTFGWREQHNIVFDHLVAPTAYLHFESRNSRNGGRISGPGTSRSSGTTEIAGAASGEFNEPQRHGGTEIL